MPVTIDNLEIAFQRHHDGLLIDGIIINDVTKSYNNTKSYKLKNKIFLTNDFLIKLIPKNKINKNIK